DFKVPANARFVIEDEKQFPGFNPIYLFREGLALITPLLWLLFALNLMGFFFLLSWTPTLLTAAKLPTTTGALAGALLQVGGTVGSLTLCWCREHDKIEVLDAAYWMKGCSSLGRLRYAVLIGVADGEPGSNNLCLIDIKGGRARRSAAREGC